LKQRWQQCYAAARIAFLSGSVGVPPHSVFGSRHVPAAFDVYASFAASCAAAVELYQVQALPYGLNQAQHISMLIIPATVATPGSQLVAGRWLSCRCKS
jgi:hypothetical protein